MHKKILRWMTYMIVLSAAVGQTQASVIFYTDRSAWENDVTGQMDIDFEGMTEDTGHLNLGPYEVIDGVAFSVSQGDLILTGKNSTISGAPFDSAILSSNHRDASLTADLSSAGTNFTAVGGFFGEINDSGSVTTITLIGASGILDSRSLVAANMGEDMPSSFFGWTVHGDTIVSVVHEFSGSWEGIDDFSYGYSVIPESSPSLLLGLGLIGLSAYSRQRR